MSAVSIIIVLVVLVVIVGFWLLIFSGHSILIYQVEKSYKKFLKNKENFSDENLHELRRDLDVAQDQIDLIMSNQRHFIDANSSDFSEDAVGVLDASHDLAKNEERKTKLEHMLQEVNREIARREHSRKYK